MAAPTTPIQIRADAKAKKEAQKVFETLGMSFATGINIYLKWVARYRAVPFSLDTNNEVPNDKTMKALQRSLADAKAGRIARFTNTKEAADFIRAI